MRVEQSRSAGEISRAITSKPAEMGFKAWLLVVAVVVSALHPAYVKAAPQDATIKVDLKKTKDLAPDLFGIFFEEVSLPDLYLSFVTTPS